MTTLVSIIDHPEHGPAVVIEEEDGVSRLVLLGSLPSTKVFSKDLPRPDTAGPAAETPIFSQLAADQPPKDHADWSPEATAPADPPAAAPEPDTAPAEATPHTAY